MSDFHVAIVGAGLVGSLSAISFARQGFCVSLYDAREDPRSSKSSAGRSINLAVSARGIGALRSVDTDLCDRVAQNSIPMKGRMIHVDESQQSQIYGLFGETISSIDRSQLNIDLLDEAEKYRNITLHFNHKLVQADLDKDELHFSVKSSEGQVHAMTYRVNLIIGCDGAYSVIRGAMMRLQRMDFSQEYIPHAYLELSIPPSDSGDFQLASDHLHIWPRQEFMLIALPNPDKSFTCTLFAPFSLFDSMSTSKDVVQLFQSHFPDALRMIEEGRLIRIWESNPVAPLIQIKCNPYHYKDKAILLGDSAHAMVPFYGQGMNCGFEDLRVLNSILASHNITPASTWELGPALAQYSTTRHDDLLAILQLAMGNYVEMRSSVTSKTYLIRKQIDTMLGKLFRNRWIPMYSMVSFREEISYSEVVRRNLRQTRVISRILYSSSGLLMTCMIGVVFASARTPSVQSVLKSLSRSILTLF